MSGLRTGATQLAASGVKDIAGGLRGIVDAVKNAAVETGATGIAMKAFGKEDVSSRFPEGKRLFWYAKNAF